MDTQSIVPLIILSVIVVFEGLFIPSWIVNAKNKRDCFDAVFTAFVGFVIFAMCVFGWSYFKIGIIAFSSVLFVMLFTSNIVMSYKLKKARKALQTQPTNPINVHHQLDTEINNAFDFYINWYQQIIENMKLLRMQGKLNHISDTQFFMMQKDLSALKSKDITTLFKIMLKKDKFEYHKLQSKINEETSICEDLCKALLSPEYYKRPQQTIEEFIHEYGTAIKVHQDNIIRLKANDINLCNELISSDRDA